MLPGQTLPLREAIQNSTAELDAAAVEFMSSTQREMDAMLGPGVFDHGMLARDVVGAFGLIKSLNFDMRLIDFDNIQAALSMKLDTLGPGPARDRVFVIQAFCQRVVEYNNSLKQRTGTNLPAPADVSAPAASNNDGGRGDGSTRTGNNPPNYETSERIVGGPLWSHCVSGSHDWARMFGRQDDDDDDRGPWLTPRMAARIHYVAVRDAELYDYRECPPRLPKLARPFFKKSKSWRLAFGDCYARIAMRLQRGLPPSPNCTGEELAFHNIMHLAPDAEEDLDLVELLEKLPTFQNDDEYRDVESRAVEDEDVLYLYEDGDTGYSFSDDEEDVDNPVLGPGSMAEFALGPQGGRMGITNLHPRDWFLAFRESNFRNHIEGS
ncbi:hypothetical protein THAOC_25419 [Thalassiosira oceanica]|uniref:Uncharacterized protein n=2 Tax=Thalassiosira oceanica TaxID=159749 RepID=K0RP86_THAOC|nr:hypothetical protein THAOC_25419 [Thalassiosira oceanica]|eukprot:EJK54910.1 hypothetical protein THAOC_25419 [Thalassiosira oceanica]